MIEQAGTVVSAEQGVVWVQTIQKSACESCSASKGCGASVLEKIGNGKAIHTPIKDTLNCQVGDEVIVGVPEAALLKSSFMVYFMPLVLMTVLAIFTDVVFPQNEAYSIIAGVIGLVAGFALSRKLSALPQFQDQLQPVLVKKISCPSELVQAITVK